MVLAGLIKTLYSKDIVEHNGLRADLALGLLTDVLFSLRKTRDAFRKLVVVGGDQPFYTDDDGISFVGVIPFLLDKTVLSGMTSGMT